jgi:serine protease
MMKHFFLSISLVFLSMALYAQDHVEGEFIVKIPKGEQIGHWENPYGLPIRLKKCLSPRMNIYLMQLVDYSLPETEILNKLRKSPGIEEAQFNHYVEIRGGQTTMPNDPAFSQQWALDNTGQTGGMADADIDAVEAWDLSQGEVNALGDTLVIAVIDDGFDLLHEDILFWKNKGEIPSNGIDDDGNGFIDDYQGWNSYADNGFVNTASHGTEVAGIIAAIADNGIGISGVGWKTAVMPISGSSSIEATVVESYDYALTQRILYEQSGGQKGAFVVATNSSFGVNNGNPSNFPIWCSMYDELGQWGILSVASTANSTINVDTQGDMPTACSSDYLITVTNTNDSDLFQSGSAYGPTTIDLGAPGTGIRTTYIGDSYGNTSGTSFASPHVSGVIALLMAGASPSFSAGYRADPPALSLQAKQWILQGTDPLNNLNGITVSGGRLNAYNALQLAGTYSNGQSSDCVGPFNLYAEGLTDTSIHFSWELYTHANLSKIRYRELGQSSWQDSLIITGMDTLIAGLSTCTAYEWEVAMSCTDGWTTYTTAPSGKVRSLGCCEAPSAFEIVEGLDSLLLSWPGVFGVDSFQLEYRQAGTVSWNSLVVYDSSYLLLNLEPCSAYEVRLWSLCGNSALDTLMARNLKTLGCGNCLDLDYCLAGGNDATFEWIDSIKIGGFSFASGNNGGYGDFTGQNIELQAGNTYPIYLNPGYSGFNFTEKWRIWIDGNQNGEFEESELIYESDPTSASVGDSIQIPSEFIPGNSRMRVGMRWAGPSFTSVPPACGFYDNGEVEDYCVVIKNPYCDSKSEGLGQYWIESFSYSGWAIKDTNHSGVDTNGYSYFPQGNDPYDLGWAIPEIWGIQEIELVSASIFPSDTVYVRMWLDFGQDGNFDSLDLFLDTKILATDTLRESVDLTGKMDLVDLFPEENTRMRMSLRQDSVPEACDTFKHGEVEDYLIYVARITSNKKLESMFRFDFFPNPTQNYWNWKADPGEKRLVLYDLHGQKLWEDHGYVEEGMIPAEGLLPGMYVLKVEMGGRLVSRKLVKE